MTPIVITPAAAERFSHLLKQNNKRIIKLRVTNKGCSGHGYHLDFADSVDATDEVIEIDNGMLIIEGKSLLFLFGIEIDWTESEFGKSFSFTNPNATALCGCGASFSV